MAKVTRRNPDESTPQWKFILQQEHMEKTNAVRKIRQALKQQQTKSNDLDYKITDEEMKDVWINPEFVDKINSLKSERLKKQNDQHSSD